MLTGAETEVTFTHFMAKPLLRHSIYLSDFPAGGKREEFARGDSRSQRRLAELSISKGVQHIHQQRVPRLFKLV